jgi:hypothetical protein
VANVGKFIAIGLNFADHAAESGVPIPKEPVVFMKATSCIQGPTDPVMLPRGSVKTDWEVELGIVIGTRARYVGKKDALAHVAGYCTINDVSEREYQLERGPQWDKGKGCDTFGPIGPWLVTPDEIENVQRLDMWLDVNGKRLRQAGELCEPLHDLAARRRHHHRHAARRRARDEAADLPEKGRRDHARHPGPGRAAPGGGGFQGVAGFPSGAGAMRAAAGASATQNAAKITRKAAFS